MLTLSNFLHFYLIEKKYSTVLFSVFLQHAFSVEMCKFWQMGLILVCQQALKK